MKKLIKKIKFEHLIIIISMFFLTITTIASVIYLYEKRHKIANKLEGKSEYSIDKKKFLLSQKILSGGYVLLFRHAEREKWIDVQMYDSIEVNKNLLAENTYFKNAVCLSLSPCR